MMMFARSEKAHRFNRGRLTKLISIVLKKAVEMAKETGANGISNLKIMRETDNTGRLLYYEVTGFCIRIR